MDREKQHPGKPPRLDELYLPPLFFVTFNALQRQALLANDACHEALRAYAERGSDDFGVAMGRYVIMPDHVHLFVAIPDDMDLGRWVKGLKRAIGKALSRRRLWQPGFFDHLLRSDESYEQKWEYVRLNPVRAGLVSREEDWPYQGEVVRIER
jgi:putative transposase